MIITYDRSINSDELIEYLTLIPSLTASIYANSPYYVSN